MTTPSDINDQQKTSQSVLHAIEKEDRARRHTLLIFLSLLVIPVAVAAYILVTGKEDAEWVKSTAQKAAAKEIEGIRPTLNNLQTLQKMAPALEKTVSRSKENISQLSKLESAAESARSQSAELITKIGQTKEQQARLANRLNALEGQSPSKDQIAALTRKLEVQDKKLNLLGDQQKQINRNIEINSGEIQNVRSLQQSISSNKDIDKKIRDLENRLEKSIRDNRNEISRLRKRQNTTPTQPPRIVQ